MSALTTALGALCFLLASTQSNNPVLQLFIIAAGGLLASGGVK